MDGWMDDLNWHFGFLHFLYCMCPTQTTLSLKSKLSPKSGVFKSMASPKSKFLKSQVRSSQIQIKAQAENFLHPI